MDLLVRMVYFSKNSFPIVFWSYLLIIDHWFFIFKSLNKFDFMIAFHYWSLPKNCNCSLFTFLVSLSYASAILKKKKCYFDAVNFFFQSFTTMARFMFFAKCRFDYRLLPFQSVCDSILRHRKPSLWADAIMRGYLCLKINSRICAAVISPDCS